jgi:hypothetical protein
MRGENCRPCYPCLLSSVQWVVLIAIVAEILLLVIIFEEDVIPL